MASVVRVLAALVLCGMILQLAPPRASACSCVPLDSSTQGVWRLTDRANAVVAGRVEPGSIVYGDSSIRARIAVERTYSGSVAGSIDVYSAGSSASCGYDFGGDDTTHLLVLYVLDQSDNTYSVNFCTSFPVAIDSAAGDITSTRHQDVLEALERHNPSPGLTIAPAVRAGEAPAAGAIGNERSGVITAVVAGLVVIGASAVVVERSRSARR
jgi:hypothetical protein